jgi:hypothetical protein
MGAAASTQWVARWDENKTGLNSPALMQWNNKTSGSSDESALCTVS